MPNPDKASHPAYEAFAADVQARHPSVVPGALFGMPSLTLGGKAFAGAYAGGVVFKLPPSEREQAATLPDSTTFDPSGRGRPMKEWVVVAVGQQAHWDGLADAAVRYVGG